MVGWRVKSLTDAELVLDQRWSDPWPTTRQTLALLEHDLG
jgi:hypothetical protein